MPDRTPPEPRPAGESAGQPKAPDGAGTTPGKTQREIGGPQGPEPTRYGDWEVKGRCSDF
jgi:hypothetical protein